MRKQLWLMGLVLLVTLVVSGCSWKRTTTLTLDQAKEKVLQFSKDNLVPPGTDIQIKEAVEENGLYKVVFTVEKQDISTYVTKDGTKFFPSAIELDKKEEPAPEDKSVAEVPKSDKPSVEMFVMSYCPYGTQIEKGVLPVLDTLKDKIDFSLRFVDYAMHGEKEVKENLRQYCIQQTEPAKLSKYLTCFLKKGEGTEASCMKTALVNSAKVASCVTATDKEFKVTEQLNDKTAWSGQFPPFNVDKDLNDQYGVQGSPTLVINGVEAQAGRDSAGLLNTICDAFNEAPSECQAALSSAAPSPGFGTGTATGGSANPSANCGS
ncbi:hypothetical protein EPO05_03930 [Patescibacteria group bacterium]|nr:MAG: hypothetical protein EPO05_03930 [Patescibacteria group bacterium]